jgi:hypothetical protein
MNRLAPLPQELTDIQVVATDMDGTLTRRGQFSPALLDALERLHQAGIAVIVVTGRSAGWVQAVVNYLPVWGAIAENGGILFTPGDEQHFLTEIEEVHQHRTALQHLFQSLQSRFPRLEEATDNLFRLTDWTFSVQGIADDELAAIRRWVESEPWSFTYSTVQCHIKPLGQTKAKAVRHTLSHYFPDVPLSSVVTVGDSPNDESLFDADIFPCSVGVANLRHYGDRLQHLPTFITQHPEVEGFCEFVQAVLR